MGVSRRTFRYWGLGLTVIGTVSCAGPIETAVEHVFDPPDIEKPRAPPQDDGAGELEAEPPPAACVEPEGGYCVPGTYLPCYDGPDDTEGVGSCSAGIMPCNAYGNAYFGCMNQILPAPNDCWNPSAWSCDATPAKCLKLEDADILSNEYYSSSLIASDNGAGWVRAYTARTANTGNLIVEHVVDGQSAWSNTYPLSSNDSYFAARSLIVGASDETLIAVNVEGSIDIDGQLIQGPAAVLLKLDTQGKPIWILQWPGEVTIYGLASVQRDIWVVGNFGDTVDFGAGPLTTTKHDGFLLRLEPDGTPLWSAAVAGAGDSALWTIAVRSDGTAYVSGYEDNGAASCNHISVTLASYDADGAPQWKHLFSSERSAATGSSLALDARGDIYLSGRISVDIGNAIDFGGGPLEGYTFLAKFDPHGSHVWSRSTNDVPHGPAIGGHVAVHPTGKIVWADQDEYSVRLRVFEPEGRLLWERIVEAKAPPPVQQGGASIVAGWGLFDFAVASDGRLAIAGSFGGSLDLGPGPVATNTKQASYGYFATYLP